MKSWINVLGTVLTLFFVVAAFGTQSPPLARGFVAGSYYNTADVDSVNAMNGNLLVTIPVGRAFTAGDRLNYQFTLTYNSSIWEYLQHCTSDGVRDLDPVIGEDIEGLCFSESIPVKDFNAGLGWRLALGGELRGDGQYISVDGATHSFWGTPQHIAVATGHGYTRDGSYIRTSGLPATRPGEVGPVVVELPNGVSETFVCATGCRTDETQPRDHRRWDLSLIEDRFGNALSVGRSSDAGATWIWTYTELARASVQGAQYQPTGVTHTVEFERVTDSDPYQWTVRSVTLASSSAQAARYTFRYAPDGSIYRDVNHAAAKINTFTQPNADPIKVPILTSVDLPAGAGQWRFQYVTPVPSADCTADYCPPDPSNAHRPYATSRTSGRLQTLRYPTGGSIEYQYGTYVWPQKHCGTNRPHTGSNFINTGVRQRQRMHDDGTPDGTPFIYKTLVSPSVEDVFHCFESTQLKAVAIEPRRLPTEDYVLTENYFNIATTRIRPEEYGLNYGPESSDPAGGGRFLTNRLLQCAPGFDPQHLFDDDYVESLCTPKRSTYVRYELSGMPCGEFSSTGCSDQNSRVVDRRTVYHDDDRPTWKRETYGDFDGLGHYRSVQVEGNFEEHNGVNFADVPGESSVRKRGRITFTNYNPGTQFTLGTQLGDGTMTGLPEKWVINTYSESRTEEYTNDASGNGLVVGRHIDQAVFNSDGYLLRTRVLKNDNPATASTPSSADLITTSQRTIDSNGRVTEAARFFGGDFSTVPTGSLESLSLGNAEYEIVTELEHGVVVNRSYVDCRNARFLVEQATVDPKTGLAGSSSDTSGATTAYQYDVTGRLTFIDPPGDDANTVIEYPSPRQVNVKRRRALDPNVVLDETTYRYGDFGHLAETKKKLPVIANEGGAVTTEWNSLERIVGPTNLLIAESTLGPISPDSSRGFTTYKQYDALGRATLVIHPDSVNGDRKTEITHGGDRVVTSKVEGITTIKKYDSLGRLVSVQEGNIPATTYRYDVQNHLIEARTESQRRLFHYDGRGFLADERPPELDGKLWFYKYDSRGNVRSKRVTGPGGDGPHSPFDLTYSYDSAERLTGVTSTLTGANVKSFAFYPYPADAQTPPLHAGKLRFARRQNRIPASTATATTTDIQVIEERGYQTTTGRLASQKVRWSPGTEVETRYQYDDLGNLVQLEYPKDTVAPGRMPARTQEFGYTQGYLTSVTGFAPTIGYYYNGLPREVRRTNGITDVYVPDPNSMSRFREIRFKKGNSPENGLYIGGYAYSARGNIVQVGADRFGYDAASRITSATVNGIAKTYVYDAHGNLTIPGAAGADPATNRLTAPASYDVAGNLVSEPYIGLKQEFDALGLMLHRNDGPTIGRIFVYDAFDERLGVIDYSPAENRDGDPANDGIRETWSLRGPGNVVLRYLVRFRPAGGGADTWTWARDFIYRGSTQLASVGPDGVRHLHTDHLGSIRRVTDGSGTILLRHDYLPFGEQIPVSRAGAERMRFSGHERDDDGTLDGRADLDYMHARFYSPDLGRFLSLDPVPGTADKPQSWNRYAYVQNNPVRFTDPDGREIGVAANASDESRFAGGGTPRPLLGNGRPASEALQDITVVVAPAYLAVAGAAAAPAIMDTAAYQSANTFLTTPVVLQYQTAAVTALIGGAVAAAESKPGETFVNVVAAFVGGALFGNAPGTDESAKAATKAAGSGLAVLITGGVRRLVTGNSENKNLLPSATQTVNQCAPACPSNLPPKEAANKWKKSN